MKRLSRKIRKRFSYSSQERRHSVKDIYTGVTQARQLPIPQLPNQNPQSAYICSHNNEIERNNRRGRMLSEPLPNPMAEASDSLDNHDYSTLDGDENENGEDVFDDAKQNDDTAANSTRSSSSEPDNAKQPDCSDTNDTCTVLISPASPMLLEFEKLARQGWYWGPMTREQAEKRLSNAPEASFLVRDSSDDRYILSLSFRSHHRTLHTRIAHSGMKFSFYEDNPKQTYTSVVELIENSMRDTNEQGVFCYSRSRQPFAPTFPVRLIHPISRLTEVRPLQDLCRFVIRRVARVDHIQNLPLPKPIKEYLHHSYF